MKQWLHSTCTWRADIHISRTSPFMHKETKRALPFLRYNPFDINAAILIDIVYTFYLFYIILNGQNQLEKFLKFNIETIPIEFFHETFKLGWL